MKVEQVKTLLELLAARDRDLGAPVGVEANVMGAFRARRTNQTRRRFVALGLAAAAAAILTVALSRPGSVPIAPMQTPSVYPASAQQSHVTKNAPTPASVPIRKTLETTSKNRGRQLAAAISNSPPPSQSVEAALPASAAAPQTTAREVVTEFFPLMDPAPPMDRAAILRVRVPASAMRSVGLPVREESLDDRVQADVLVGEEGLPRAIRFVTVQMR